MKKIVITFLVTICIALNMFIPITHADEIIDNRYLVYEDKPTSAEISQQEQEIENQIAMENSIKPEVRSVTGFN
ncbi:hypothetical protein [Paraliobacillus sp. JSM ZJ581]|uniref:hypothetical protein n=1 Tax=Paraliobacillus sp. JSM ZJ581 TaxID=3342118 RepID=UPI0035A82E86